MAKTAPRPSTDGERDDQKKRPSHLATGAKRAGTLASASLAVYAAFGAPAAEAMSPKPATAAKPGTAAEIPNTHYENQEIAHIVEYWVFIAAKDPRGVAAGFEFNDPPTASLNARSKADQAQARVDVVRAICAADPTQLVLVLQRTMSRFHPDIAAINTKTAAAVQLLATFAKLDSFGGQQRAGYFIEEVAAGRMTVQHAYDTAASDATFSAFLARTAQRAHEGKIVLHPAVLAHIDAAIHVGLE